MMEMRYGNTNVMMAALSGASLLVLYHMLQSSRQEQTKKNKKKKEYEDVGNDLCLMKEEDEDDCIYLDYNGTTPIDPLVIDAMMPFFQTHFGNPSSTHSYGKVPREAIADARQALVQLILGGNNDDAASSLADGIVFTGCGTEADNMAIHLALQQQQRSSEGNDNKKPHIVTSNIEHPAITAYLQSLEARGEVDVTYVPVNEEGIVNVVDVIDAIDTERTVLVTIMLANNEVGSLQPIHDIAIACRTMPNVLFHTDAAQAIGKIPNLHSTLKMVDMITIVGHKFGAPKGIAALYIRPDCPITFQNNETTGFLLGGGQEMGRRAGTENVPYIVGMGQAAKVLLQKQKHIHNTTITTTTNTTEMMEQWEINVQHMRCMRNRLLDQLAHHLDSLLLHDNNDDDMLLRVNGPEKETNRLPNTLSVGIKGVHSGKLLQNIQHQVACSAGSACHASENDAKVSSVLMAMKVPMEYARGTLRLSVGPNTTIQQIDKAAQIISDEVKNQLLPKKRNQS